jgi:hypothetical protein
MPRIQTGSQREQQFFKGVEVESAEHPWLSAREVERLVNDHLDEDPRHYSRPQENPANVKKFLGAPDVCDICHKLFGDKMYDAPTRMGPWGCLCEKCYRRHAYPGMGQAYKRVGDEWIKVRDLGPQRNPCHGNPEENPASDRDFYTKQLIELEQKMNDENLPDVRRKAAMLKYRRLSEQLHRGVPSSPVGAGGRSPTEDLGPIVHRAVLAGIKAATTVDPQIFPFGWAYVCTKDKAVARRLLDVELSGGPAPQKAFHGDLTKGRRGYYKLFVELPGSPTLPRQEAFANAVVSVLQNASYDAWSESAWD